MPRVSPAVVIGRTITPARLRDGQYMPRPQALASLVETWEERRSLLRAPQQGRVQVLWVRGPSGSGKSVLLVQLLEHLAREGTPVLWLGDAVEALEPLLRDLASGPVGTAPQAILVDDIYSRDARDALDLPRLGRLVAEGGAGRWPLLVTCGPREFEDAFRIDARPRGLDVSSWEIPPMDGDDARRMLAWYRSRAGQDAHPGEAFQRAASGRGLALAMAVDLTDGPLEDFAERLVARIRAVDLEQALRLPLALNRLYLSPPSGWLDARARERLQDLEDGGDLLFSDSDSPASRLRLTHPHLADALYDGLRARSQVRARADDLVGAFRRALAERDCNLVGRLLRVLSRARPDTPQGARLQSVDLRALADGCVDAWREAEAGRALPIWPSGDAEADAWVSWACWSAAVPGVARVLPQADLVLRALRALDAAPTLWPPLWLALRRHLAHRQEILQWARDALCAPERMPSSQWSWVWEACAPPRGAPLDRWAEGGWTWLSRFPEAPDWHFVWRALLRHPDTAPSAREVSEAWLAPQGREARDRTEHPGWAYVLQDALADAEHRRDAAATGRLVALGWRWLQGRQDRPEWNFVWHAVLEHPQDLDAVEGGGLGPAVALGWEWLHSHMGRTEWPFIWRTLFRHLAHLPPGASLPILVGLGWEWLRERDDRMEWRTVWDTLLEHSLHLPSGVTSTTLVGLGWEWLKHHHDRIDWNFVWQAVLKRSSSLPEGVTQAHLVEEAWAWLPAHQERPGWSHVWEALPERCHLVPAITLDRVLDLGLAWVRRHQESPDGPVTWYHLARHVRGHRHLAAVVDLGRRWIQEPMHENSPGIGWISEGLLELGAMDPATARVLDPWLLTTTHAGARVVAAKRIAWDPEHPTSRRLALRLAHGLKSGATPVPAFVNALKPLQGRPLPPDVQELVDVALAPRAPSQRVPMRVAGVNRAPAREPAPADGDVRMALVLHVQPYGVIASIGTHRGLIQRRSLPRFLQPTSHFHPGEQIRVKVVGRNEKGLILEWVQEAQGAPAGD